MNTFLGIILLIAVGCILFNALYFNIFCVYTRTRCRYRLFALRDRLRRIQIDHPTCDRELCNSMELRINGSIGLIDHISVLDILCVRFVNSLTDVFSDDDKKAAAKMAESLARIQQNKEGGLEKLLYEIEMERLKVFRDSVKYNSPYYVYICRPIVRLINVFISLTNRTVQNIDPINKTNMIDYQERLAPVMVRAACHPVSFVALALSKWHWV